MKHHSHSHREPLPRHHRRETTPEQRRRIEHRELEKALGPREVVVRLPQSVGRKVGADSMPGWGRDSWQRRRALERLREREKAARG